MTSMSMSMYSPNTYGASYRSVAFGTWKVGEARQFSDRYKRHRTPEPLLDERIKRNQSTDTSEDALLPSTSKSLSQSLSCAQLDVFIKPTANLLSLNLKSRTCETQRKFRHINLERQESVDLGEGYYNNIPTGTVGTDFGADSTVGTIDRANFATADHLESSNTQKVQVGTSGTTGTHFGTAGGIDTQLKEFSPLSITTEKSTNFNSPECQNRLKVDNFEKEGTVDSTASFEALEASITPFQHSTSLSKNSTSLAKNSNSLSEAEKELINKFRPVDIYATLKGHKSQVSPMEGRKERAMSLAPHHQCELYHATEYVQYCQEYRPRKSCCNYENVFIDSHPRPDLNRSMDALNDRIIHYPQPIAGHFAYIPPNQARTVSQFGGRSLAEVIGQRRMVQLPVGGTLGRAFYPAPRDCKRAPLNVERTFQPPVPVVPVQREFVIDSQFGEGLRYRAKSLENTNRWV
ncbi:unnamed protein product [Bursaphelenchus okinawaensis]|uniref:Uncharacterized protein n=1 Tax=Bursaphelenchus okinawaensis TaxID=465554 RepID=A0A811K1V2_9BILA|nr:unnamed protein product [Bursaphelenchus okinawaensis]CAG9089241.1 unnamed protein product [Bursaphelenchus okinawaensis]